MKSKKTTPRKRDILFDDRSSDNNYSYINQDNKRVAWEEYAVDDYSTLHIGGRTFDTYEKGVKAGSELVFRYLPVMGVPLRMVRVKFLEENKSNVSQVSNSDSFVMKLDTNVFKDFAISSSARLDVFLGYLIHEAAHILYTNFRSFTHAVKTSRINMAEKHIFNIVEDEYIERRVGDHTPGYSRYLSRMKYYTFDTLYLKYKEKQLSEIEEEYRNLKSTRMMSVLFNMVRYPKYLSDEDRDEFSDFINSVNKILKPFPESTDASIGAAKEIYKLFDKQISDDAKKMAGKDSAKSANDLTDEDVENITNYIQAIESVIENMSEEFDKYFGIDDDNVMPGSSQSPAASKGGSKPAPLFGAASSAILSALENDVNSVLSGETEFGTDQNIRFNKTKPDKSGLYSAMPHVNNNFSAVRTYLKRNHRDYKIVMRGMKSGYLDVSKIAEAHQGVENIYIREAKVKSDRISVAYLIDASGSMGMDFGGMTVSKIDLAKATAVMISKAIKGSPDVKGFFGYAYSSEVRSNPDETDIFVLDEPGFSGGLANIGSVSSQGTTHEGVAVSEVATRIRKFTKYPVILFVLSDGEPYGTNYNGQAAIDHTRDMAIKAEKMGIQVVHIAIDEDASSSQKLMYKNFVNYSNSNSLPGDIIKLMKKMIRVSTRSKIYY